MLRALTAAAVAVAILGAVGCAGGDESSSASGELVNLATARPVADAFNADRGTPRLLLLLSPT